MNKENILSFKLEKSNKDSKIIVNYYVPEIYRNRTDEIKESPHGDLLAALSSLNIYLSKVFHTSDKYVNNMAATGFKRSTDTNVIITGKFVSDSGSVVGLATPAINLDDDTYGFESDLNDDINNLTEEVFLLLTGKKVGVRQMTIDEQPDENTKTVFEVSEEEELLPEETVSPINDDFLLPD